MSHVVSELAVAPRDGAQQRAPLVDQVDGDAINLRLHHVRGRGVRAEPFHHPLVEFPDFVLIVGVVHAQHGHNVGSRPELIYWLSADFLGGTVGGDKLGVFALEPLELFHERVELAVGDLRLVLDVVEVVVAVDLLAKLLDSAGDIFLRGHGLPPFLDAEPPWASCRGNSPGSLTASSVLRL